MGDKIRSILSEKRDELETSKMEFLNGIKQRSVSVSLRLTECVEHLEEIIEYINDIKDESDKIEDYIIDLYDINQTIVKFIDNLDAEDEINYSYYLSQIDSFNQFDDLIIEMEEVADEDDDLCIED